MWYISTAWIFLIHYQTSFHWRLFLNYYQFKCIRKDLRFLFLHKFNSFEIITDKYLIISNLSALCLGAAVAQSVESSALDRRARVWGSSSKNLTCTLVAPGACKTRRGCNVFQDPIQIIPLAVQKRGSHPLCGWWKLRWYVSGSSSGMNPRPSAMAHYHCSSPTLNPTKQPNNQPHYV